MKYAGFFLLFFLLSLFSCKTNGVVSPNEHKGNQLWLSHGGGFAGTYKTYCLLDNGQLFKGTKQMDPVNPVKGLKKETVTQIFSNYKILGLQNEKIESYGNLNYSITMINKDGERHKLIWEKGQGGTENLQLFYRNIMNQIRLNDENGNGESKTDAVQ